MGNQGTVWGSRVVGWVQRGGRRGWAGDRGFVPSAVGCASMVVMEFVCPRCGTASTQEFYGPCGDCRASLRAVLGGPAREVAAPEYVPKTNVTPNAVALKE